MKMNAKRSVSSMADLLVEILERVPAKDLPKLKLVCTEWKSLITDLEFRRLRALLQPLIIYRSMRYFCFYITQAENRIVPFNFTHTHPDANSSPKILDSRHGLILLQYSDLDFYVYNPTTRKSRKLSLTRTARYTNLCMLKFEWDPSMSAGDFNILCIRCCEKGRVIQAEVYDSVSGCWKLQVEGLTTPSRICAITARDHRLRMEGLTPSSELPPLMERWEYCNNKIYGRCHDLLPFSLDTRNYQITFFDFPETSTLFSIGHPYYGIKGKDCHYNIKARLQESNGHMYYIKLGWKYNDGKELIALWELQSDHTWVSMYGDFLIVRSEEIEYPIKLFIGSDHCCLLISRGHTLWLYNFLDKSFKKIVDDAHDYSRNPSMISHLLPHSSLPFNGMTASSVGQSGSGKSTVISLIERFYDPVSGGVLIDGINLREFQLKWIRSKMGLVSQEPVLSTSSIQDNIAYGKVGATLEEIRAAS